MEDVSAHHATDLVHLNVGGRNFTTLVETLVRSQSAYFARFMRIDPSGKVLLLRRLTQIDRDGAIFINRDGELFAYALQFMRDGRRTVLPEEKILLKQLVREAEYFGMDMWKEALMGQLEIVEREGDGVS
ncbi:K+ channel tetramerization domain protein [Oesophagostomum dentatum]|uniref:K+ channel tetramerization domain protein n=1 Tax=Oesophagostomum dentatum TaxID=61180 RepID=A0A0B1S8A9_OESDE|nr:K+ channel tetramerization domain protein [Oesophagostomum dentatum]